MITVPRMMKSGPVRWSPVEFCRPRS